jgi:hypothetical protein
MPEEPCRGKHPLRLLPAPKQPTSNPRVTAGANQVLAQDAPFRYNSQSKCINTFNHL